MASWDVDGQTSACSLIRTSCILGVSQVHHKQEKHKAVHGNQTRPCSFTGGEPILAWNLHGGLTWLCGIIQTPQDTVDIHLSYLVGPLFNIILITFASIYLQYHSNHQWIWKIMFWVYIVQLVLSFCHWDLQYFSNDIPVISVNHLINSMNSDWLSSSQGDGIVAWYILLMFIGNVCKHMQIGTHV